MKEDAPLYYNPFKSDPSSVLSKYIVVSTVCDQDLVSSVCNCQHCMQLLALSALVNTKCFSQHCVYFSQHCVL